MDRSRVQISWWEILMKGLKRWFAEKWTTPSGEECGSFNEKGVKDGKCRPSKRVTSNTPKTWGEMSSKEKKKAIRDKAQASKEGEQYGKVRFSKVKARLKK